MLLEFSKCFLYSGSVLSCFIHLYSFFFSFFWGGSASLIRRNQANCAHFSGSLDWLISRLDRLEASSGAFQELKSLIYKTWLIFSTNFWYAGQNAYSIIHSSYLLPMACVGVLEVLHCVLVESPQALNAIKEGHIQSIIAFLDKHGRNHKVWLTRLCFGWKMTQLMWQGFSNHPI